VSLICFASQKGAPGTTLTALAVAASWPTTADRRKILMEADRSGGVLALRYQLGLEPGLVTLAAAARGGLDDATVWEHTQTLPGGLPVIVAPDGPEQAEAAIEASGGQIARSFAERRDLDTIADLGRLSPRSPALSIASEADAVLMVARPEVEQLQPAARLLASLSGKCRNMGWVLVGDRPHGRTEVEDAYGVAVVATIADDRRGATAAEQGASGRRLARTPLVRSAASLADQLQHWLHAEEPAEPSVTAEPVAEATLPAPTFRLAEPHADTVAGVGR